ncbi:MAG: metalloregulator ArsR/SmtB family transcription factor [Acidimicrobiia bacterium]|nr:metalloregulator ArsR/SmtB family transcription factor [Acidimicrobiia bacterium]
MDRIFAALGDPVRRHILQVLSVDEHPVGAVVESLHAKTPISQPAVSQHLKVLRDAGLVTARSEGTRRLHSLDPAGIDTARAWLTALTDRAAHFEQPLDALETEIARGRRAHHQPAEPATEKTGTEDKRLA